MVWLRTVVTCPFSVSLLIVGLLLCPLFVGIEPIGGDPDMMYRPIKFATLTREDRVGEAWFIHGEGPPEAEVRSRHLLEDFVAKNLTPRTLDIKLGAPAQTAQVKAWDDRTLVVENDGTCYLVVRRTYYPGWFYQINGGPERPILKVNGGLQCVPLTGAETNRVTFDYRLPGQCVGAAISLGSTAATLVVLIVGLVQGQRAL